MTSDKRMLSVGQVNEYLKMMMDGDRVLSNIFVRGEISNFKLYSSGHAYFTLKDESGQLKAVMFRSYASRLAFLPSDGMQVIAHGRISVYETSGQYQLYADELQPDGAGSLALRFEQLKRKLQSEGLFDESRKKPLPVMPSRIGVITSPSGAAVHDMIHILKRRFPLTEMILFPSAVQGNEAPMQLIAGIEFFGNTDLVDLIIIGRGGGSAEDLWAFNDEGLAYAIAACRVPVISAVGHESDFTICDFVADRRAPTPSAAAEIAVPDRASLLKLLDEKKERAAVLLGKRLTQERRALELVTQSRVFKYPERLFDAYRVCLTDMEEDMNRAVSASLSERRNLLLKRIAQMESLSPLSVLSRGYASVSVNGVTVQSVHDTKEGDVLNVRFSDGCVKATVEGKEVENG